MSKLFLCSDLHLGHRLMVRKRTFGGRDSGRPFESIEEHDAHIAECWRRVVGSDDVVIVLGDVAFNARGLEVLRNLPGRKKLALGNHDNKKMAVYMEIFTSVRAYRILDGDVLLAHMPVHPLSLSPRYRAQIHGHIHDRTVETPLAAVQGPIGVPAAPDTRYLNLCPEIVGYEPLEYTEVLRRLPPRRDPPVFAC